MDKTKELQVETMFRQKNSTKNHTVQQRKNRPLTKDLVGKFKIAVLALASATTIGISARVGYQVGKNNVQSAYELQQENEELAYNNALEAYKKEAQKILDSHTQTSDSIEHTLTQGTQREYQTEVKIQYDHNQIAEEIQKRETERINNGLSNDTKYLIAGLYEIIPYGKSTNLDGIIKDLKNANYSSLKEYIHWQGYEDIDEFLASAHLDQMNKTKEGRGL